MQRFLLATATCAATLLAACNNNPSAGNSDSATTQAQAQAPAAETPAASPVQAIISGYLQLKNALAADNAAGAATAGSALAAAFKQADASGMDAAQAKTFEDIRSAGIEHGEHINENAGNIKHQREHFEMLSKDVYDLVKTFGAGRPLYYDFCPMYNDNKGGYWLSEVKDIQNPYFGQSMATCGSVKEELK